MEMGWDCDVSDGGFGSSVLNSGGSRNLIESEGDQPFKKEGEQRNLWHSSWRMEAAHFIHRNYHLHLLFSPAATPSIFFLLFCCSIPALNEM